MGPVVVEVLDFAPASGPSVDAVDLGMIVWHNLEPNDRACRTQRMHPELRYPLQVFGRRTVAATAKDAMDGLCSYTGLRTVNGMVHYIPNVLSQHSTYFRCISRIAFDIVQNSLCNVSLPNPGWRSWSQTQYIVHGEGRRTGTSQLLKSSLNDIHFLFNVFR